MGRPFCLLRWSDRTCQHMSSGLIFDTAWVHTTRPRDYFGKHWGMSWDMLQKYWLSLIYNGCWCKLWLMLKFWAKKTRCFDRFTFFKAPFVNHRGPSPSSIFNITPAAHMDWEAHCAVVSSRGRQRAVNPPRSNQNMTAIYSSNKKYIYITNREHVKNDWTRFYA